MRKLLIALLAVAFIVVLATPALAVAPPSEWGGTAGNLRATDPLFPFIWEKITFDAQGTIDAATGHISYKDSAGWWAEADVFSYYPLSTGNQAAFAARITSLGPSNVGPFKILVVRVEDNGKSPKVTPDRIEVIWTNDEINYATFMTNWGEPFPFENDSYIVDQGKLMVQPAP
jgi:hypothetical protein